MKYTATTKETNEKKEGRIKRGAGEVDSTYNYVSHTIYILCRSPLYTLRRIFKPDDDLFENYNNNYIIDNGLSFQADFLCTYTTSFGSIVFASYRLNWMLLLLLVWFRI